MAASDRFREHMAKASAADPAVEAMVIEACRIIDRLAELDGIITGKTEWIQLLHFRTNAMDSSEVTVTVDGVLSEARQQASVLDRLLARLGLGKAELAGAEGKVSDPLDELSARRASRRGSTAR